MPTSGITREILTCFLIALEETFRVQMAIDSEVLAMKANRKPPSENVMGARLEFSSSSEKGFIQLLMSEKVLDRLYEKMTGESLHENPVSQDDRLSAATEITNIFYASARKKINEIGNSFLPAIPRAVYMPSAFDTRAWSATICIFCEAEFGEFTVELAVARVAKNG